MRGRASCSKICTGSPCARSAAPVRTSTPMNVGKQEARHLLNLVSLPPRRSRRPLWKTLELSYFARHDAGDIAWHAPLAARAGRDDASPSCEPAPVRQLGEGLQVLVYAPGPAGSVHAHLRLLRQRRLQHPRREDPHDRRPAMRSTRSRWTSPPFEQRLPRPHRLRRDPALASALPANSGPLPEPSRADASRAASSRSRSRRGSPSRPDERGPGLVAWRSRPATTPGCSTRSPACWRTTTSTCSSRRSRPLASASRTPS